MELNVNPEVRARILSAIEDLYDHLGRSDQFPTQAEVRSKAKTDMNSCSLVYREWKRQQTARPVMVAVEVPESLKQVHLSTVATIWSTAQEQANAHLRDAESKWEHERADNETMRRELAEAYEAALKSTEDAQASLAESQRREEFFAQENKTLSLQLAEAREKLAQQTTRADENERRANDLKDELGLAHAEAKSIRQELTEARLLHIEEVDEVKSAASTQLERLSERQASTMARLDAANEQSEQRQAALAEAQEKLAKAVAQADAANDELKRSRAELERKQQQADEFQQQLSTVRAQLGELQRSHEVLVGEASRSRQLADESSREFAKASGVLQETQRQNAELMERLTSELDKRPKDKK